MTDLEQIEEVLSNYPLIQYEFCDPADVPFSEKVRTICREECERYGKSWSCPPGVGEVHVCQERILACRKILLYTTQAEVSDSAVFSEALASRRQHEELTRELLRDLRSMGLDCFALSGDSCQICDSCAYPQPCRHPEQAIPCIESYGILVVELAERFGIEFYSDSRTVTWFGMIGFRNLEF